MEYLDINMMKIISSFIFIVVFFKIVFKKIISKYSGVENGYIISLVNSLKGFDYLVGIIIGVYLITYFVVLDNRWVILIEKISTAIIIIMITRVASKTASYVIKNLKYQGENKWQGINYMHMPQSNYRKEDGKVNIVMDDDKQSFSANGTTYTRQ